eukprot:CAMPEP_0177599176 /NCGR_PEP_ID=MMETSP0419_2-20121207/12824_1 /TAXON_ID=582737 /ORGANISM="Tetraselmis sp., Strain GSL018" /LENGTH=343 /DNA_ID=CAMNT_0019091833 /DNA_START=91 /DNA_END=1122 /DNA_ORIENTATION=-
MLAIHVALTFASYLTCLSLESPPSSTGNVVVTGIFGDLDTNELTKYLSGVTALAGSLIYHDVKADRVLLLSRGLWEGLQPHQLAGLNRLWQIVPVETIRCRINEDALFKAYGPVQSQLQKQRHQNTCTKFHVFGLEGYTKALWMDSDTVAVGGVGALFELPARFAAAADPCGPHILNSGVMLLEPDPRVLEALKALNEAEGSFDAGDQGILNLYFGAGWHSAAAAGSGEPGSGVARLPPQFNAPPTAVGRWWDGLGAVLGPALEARGLRAGALGPNRVVHFMGANDKPWDMLRRILGLAPESRKEAIAAIPYREAYDQWLRFHSLGSDLSRDEPSQERDQCAA